MDLFLWQDTKTLDKKNGELKKSSPFSMIKV